MPSSPNCFCLSALSDAFSKTGCFDAIAWGSWSLAVKPRLPDLGKTNAAPIQQRTRMLPLVIIYIKHYLYSCTIAVALLRRVTVPPVPRRSARSPTDLELCSSFSPVFIRLLHPLPPSIYGSIHRTLVSSTWVRIALATTLVVLMLAVVVAVVLTVWQWWVIALPVASALIVGSFHCITLVTSKRNMVK